MDNNTYYRSYLQSPLNTIYTNSIDTQQNTIYNYNPNNYNPISSSIPLSFNIPKQTNFLNYQPSTPTRKKNIIDLNDNSKLKKSQNISVVYRKLNTFEPLNYLNKDYIRFCSPIHDKLFYKQDNNYYNPHLQNSTSNINLDDKIFRLAKTPEPKKINFNEYHSQNQYNINIYVNNTNNSNNSTINQNKNFENQRRIKLIPNQSIRKAEVNNIKYQNNIQVKKGIDVNYNGFSNRSNSNQINSSSQRNSLPIQLLRNQNICNSPMRRDYITMSPDRNSYFYNSPNRVSIKPENLMKNQYNNNYYNSPERKNKFDNNIVTNKNDFNNLYSPSKNVQYNIPYQNNINSIKINDNNQGRLSNNYYSPQRLSSPIDNMRNRQPKITNDYNQIKSDNLIKRIIPPKITQNRVNLIPIPKKLINEKIDNYSVSNFLNSQIYSTNDKYKNQYNMQDSNIKKVQINQQNFQKPLNRNSLLSGHNNNILIKKLEPENDFNTKEFKIIKKLGEGTFGKIYAIKWLKTNDLYALKKMDLDEYDVYVFQKKVRIIQNFIKSTKHNGVIKLYGDKSIPIQNTNQFNYYVIMELAERDFEKEINSRRVANKYYTEEELLDIIIQLVKTLSLMQKNNITHRDVKPQNILLIKGFYKLCDFGETKIITGVGPILQSVRGSELYMSPILFYAYNKNVPSVLHNTYKSDVFSLGMCTLLAACLTARPLCDLREIKNMITIETIIINNLINRYSKKMINLIIKMLEIDENLRMDFIQLEEYISNIWPDKEYYFNNFVFINKIYYNI
jgi:hypothetical protein